MKIPVETSARHIHLSEKDFKKLFGNKRLIPIKKLSQPGEFASKETLNLIKGKNKISNVRVVGPLRKSSQIEISKTDAIELEINPPVRMSGNIRGAPKIKIKNTKIPVIIAQRHLHCSEKDAKKLKIKNHQKISIKISGKRETTFHDIIARVSDNYKLALHIDTDEANAAGINKKAYGYILR